MTTTETMNGSKFDMLRNPAYQLNCEVQSKGRRFAGTKRRVKWSFGFADLECIEQGKSGNECRGAEHEVVMVWSLASGKQRVLADGIEVHFANCRVGDKFECEWTMNGGHNVKIVAHISPPLIGEKFRQYDLAIDGISYWDMPKIYQLGKKNINRGAMQPSRRRSQPLPLSPHSCHGEGELYASNHCLAVHQERAFMRPRRAQSMIQLNQHVPVTDLLSDSSPQSDAKLISPSSQASLSSSLDPFTSMTVSPHARPNLTVDPYAPIAVSSWHYGVVTPDSSSVCSMSSRSIETAPPALSSQSPMERALTSLVNLDGYLQPMSSPSASSNPFDDFQHFQQIPHQNGTVLQTPAFDSRASSAFIVPYGQQHGMKQQPFGYSVPHTVYAGQ